MGPRRPDFVRSSEWKMQPNEAAHISFRSASADDMPWISEHIREFRLDDENLHFQQFIVAEREGRAVGFGRIKPYQEVSELATPESPSR